MKFAVANTVISEPKAPIFVLKKAAPAGIPDIRPQGEEVVTTGRWTAKEHLKFIEGIIELLTFLGLKRHGKQWKVMESEICTRTSSQIRTHAQKFFLRLRALTKLKKEADLMKYVRAHPSNFFVNEYEKYARLGVLDISEDQVHSDPAAISQTALKRGLCPLDVPSQMEPKFKRTGGTGSADEPFKYRPMSTEIFTPSYVPASEPQRAANVGYNPGNARGNVGQMVKVMDENRELGRALEKIYLDLSAYCQHVSTFTMMARLGATSRDSINYGEYLRQTGLALKSLMRSIADSQSKSSAMMTYLIMQMQMDTLQGVCNGLPRPGPMTGKQ